VRRRLPRSCRWSTCVAQRSQRQAHVASGPSVRTSSTVSTTKQKVGSGGDCRAPPRQQTRLPPGAARGAPGPVSASRPRRQAAGRPPGAAGRARAKQTGSAQPRTCASTPLRAPASPHQSAPLLLLLASGGARLKQRRVGAVRAHNLQLARAAPSAAWAAKSTTGRRTGESELLARLRQVPARLGEGRVRHLSHLSASRLVSTARREIARRRAFWLRASVTKVGQSVSPRKPLPRGEPGGETGGACA